MRRNKNAHKNDFGHLLVAAGSPSMLGAPCLTAIAAMRSGVGLVTAAVPQSLNLALQKKMTPVVMTWPVPETKDRTFAFSAFSVLMKRISRFQAAAVGPGIGLSSGTIRFVSELVGHYPLPLVVDADALNALARDPKILLKASSPRILTPHAGEMARLTGMSRAAVEKKRKAVACDFAERYRCIVVLKGAQTLIACSNRKVYMNTTGNQGMATAGSGDALTGMIAAFLAQGIDPVEAARWAVYLHGCAGDIAASRRNMTSMIALDIIEAIPEALSLCAF